MKGNPGSSNNNSKKRNGTQKNAQTQFQSKECHVFFLQMNKASPEPTQQHINSIENTKNWKEKKVESTDVNKRKEQQKIRITVKTKYEAIMESEGKKKSKQKFEREIKTKTRKETNSIEVAIQTTTTKKNRSIAKLTKEN